MKRLAEEEWEKSFELVPRVAVDLVLVRRRFWRRQILLSKRRRPPFAGYWHIPGSFVLRGEALADCITRIARDELGVEVKKWWWGGVFENLTGDPRGHVIDLIYYGETEEEPRAVGDTAEVKWFSRLPEMGFGQEEMLKKLGVL